MNCSYCNKSNCCVGELIDYSKGYFLSSTSPSIEYPTNLVVTFVLADGDIPRYTNLSCFYDDILVSEINVFGYVTRYFNHISGNEFTASEVAALFYSLERCCKFPGFNLTHKISFQEWRMEE